MPSDTNHRVQLGECLSSIADSYGYYWKTLWDLPENADLKDQRKNSNILMPGDTVFVPARRLKNVPASTDARHQFVRRGAPIRFRLRLFSSGQPRPGLKYLCSIDSGPWIPGKTDSDGLISLPIPPGAKSGIVRITDGALVEEYQLTFGEMNPIQEVSGIQMRLRNLGYDCQDTGQVDEQTSDAISSFRADEGMAKGGTIDDALRDALLQAHGS